MNFPLFLQMTLFPQRHLILPNHPHLVQSLFVQDLGCAGTKSLMRIKHSDLRGPPYLPHNRRPSDCLNAKLSKVCYENEALENARKCTTLTPCTHSPHITWKSLGTEFQSTSLECSKVTRTRHTGRPQNSTWEATETRLPSLLSAPSLLEGAPGRQAAQQGSRVTPHSRGACLLYPEKSSGKGMLCPRGTGRCSCAPTLVFSGAESKTGPQSQGKAWTSTSAEVRTRVSCTSVAAKLPGDKQESFLSTSTESKSICSAQWFRCQNVLARKRSRVSGKFTRVRWHLPPI